MSSSVNQHPSISWTAIPKIAFTHAVMAGTSAFAAYKGGLSPKGGAIFGATVTPCILTALFFLDRSQMRPQTKTSILLASAFPIIGLASFATQTAGYPIPFFAGSSLLVISGIATFISIVIIAKVSDLFSRIARSYF